MAANMGVSAISAALSKQVENQEPNIATVTLGGSEFKIGASPMSAADFSKVNSMLAKDAEGQSTPYAPFQNNPSNFSGQVLMIIRKAKLVVDDELSSDKAFTIADKANLMLMDVSMIANIFADLFGDQLSEDDDGDDTEKS